jgi:hypothetical protein
MNRPLHLYMLEMLTPYLFKSNRRKTSQEHPSAKERSSVLKTLKTVGTMYIPSVLSYKNTLRIKHQDEIFFLKGQSLSCICPIFWHNINTKNLSIYFCREYRWNKPDIYWGLLNPFAVLQSQNICIYSQKMADTIDVTVFPLGFQW